MTEALRIAAFAACFAGLSLVVASYIGARLARMSAHYPVSNEPGGSREEASPGSVNPKG